MIILRPIHYIYLFLLIPDVFYVMKYLISLNDDYFLINLILKSLKQKQELLLKNIKKK